MDQTGASEAVALLITAAAEQRGYLTPLEQDEKVPVRGPLVEPSVSSDEISTVNAGALHVWASSDERAKAMIINTKQFERPGSPTLRTPPLPRRPS